MIFYNEIDFRETSLGRVPKNWDVVPAEKLCTKVTDGTHDTPKPADEGYFLVTSKHIKNGRIDFSEAYLISKDDFDETNKRSKVDAYDVLFSMIGTVGLTTVVTTEYPAFAIKNIGLFKTKTDKKLANWLHYYFASSFSQRYIQKNLKGTTQKYIPLYALRKFPIVLPHPSERQRIVEVLSVVDLAIGKVDEVIAKIERLKKGLMQELLTKGMGHKEFKDTKIGKTPKEWQVVKLGEIISLEYGKGLPKRERIAGAYPVCGSNGIVGYHNETLVEGPGIVVGRKGTMGAVSWVDSDFWPIDTTYYIRTKKEDISLKWLFFELIYLNLKKLHLSDVVPGLKRDLVYLLKAAFPPLIEQQKIAEVLSTVDNKLELERKEKVKLERIKQGLMDLLLTGKVRVKVAD